MKKLTLFLFLLISAVPSIAQDTEMKALEAEIAEITDSPYLKTARWSFVVQEAESGKTLVDLNPDETLLPASTMKTVTSAAALGILGENYRFSTYLEHDGEIVDGVLKGNLFIRGSGDPTLGSERFKEKTNIETLLNNAVSVVKAKGITKVEGRVIGDASIFEDAMVPVNWVWNDIGNYYGAGACGLTFHENMYYLYFEPNDTVGNIAKLLRMEPEIPGIDFVNEMKTGKKGSGDQGYIYGGPYTDLRYLRGSIPQGKSEFYIKGSMPDPALYAAYCMNKALEDAAISVSKDPETIRSLSLKDNAPDQDRTLLSTYKSPPLKDIVYWLNKKSVNLYAEHLLKAIGQKKLKDGSTEGGAKAVKQWWKAKGIDVDGLFMNDGSGLSRYNGVTGRQLCNMLQKNTQQTWFNTFYESLPIAGISSDPGTIRRMCKNTAAAGNVRAKSGYISRVRSYAGYVDTQSGKRLCFAMVANNFTCKASQMRNMFADLMVKLAELP